MMAAWAEIVAAEKDKSPVVSSHTGYDPELERRRLEFEMWKYEREAEERKDCCCGKHEGPGDQNSGPAGTVILLLV